MSSSSSSSLRPFSPQSLPPLSKPTKLHYPPAHLTFSTTLRHFSAISAAVSGDVVLPVKTPDLTDHQEGLVAGVGGDTLKGGGGGGGGGEGNGGKGGDYDKFVERAINASIVLAAGSFAISKLLTIDHDFWHGWTLFEILRYAPEHNWTAYEKILKTNPAFAKMVISGVVYSLGDWIAQAGWKLWPFAHLVTYGVIPVEQRLLWVDCVELIWVTILSTLSNQKSEARLSEVSTEATISNASEE